MKSLRPKPTSLAALAVLVIALGVPQVYAEGSDNNLMLDKRIAPARARVEALRKTLEDYRDHPSESDFRTIWVQSGRDEFGNPRAQMRRVPTEEFLAKLERTEAELKEAEGELKALERSLY
jgi:hypothetical protein